MDRYLHTLRFMCPHCGLPVKLMRIMSDEANRERIDEQQILINCDSCRKALKVPGRMAKSHTIIDLHQVIW
jgi:hypothetical protein